MTAGRLLGTGFIAILISGCAAQTHKPVGSTAQAKSSTTQPTAEQPRWEASSTPAELLAQKTAAYAKTLQNSDSLDSQSAAQPEVSAALFTDARKHHLHEDTAPTAVAPAPVQGVTPPPQLTQPAAAAMVTPASVGRHADLNDGPKIMPESADFASNDAPSKDDLGTKLRKRTRANPQDIADQLDLQLYGMLNDDPLPELASVTELPNEDRELVSALIDGLSNFRSTVREDSNMLQAKKIQPLLEMADRLRSQADLSVSTIALCRRVDGFGKYDPISPVRFPATQSNRAIVYCEVQNFLPKQTGAVWQTKLTEQVTLYSDTGVLAWSDDKREVTDECRNRRHDFFAYNIIDLPPTLTVGRYLLKVSIEDKNADKVAEATVPVEMVGK